MRAQRLGAAAGLRTCIREEDEVLFADLFVGPGGFAGQLHREFIHRDLEPPCLAVLLRNADHVINAFFYSGAKGEQVFGSDLMGLRACAYIRVDLRRVLASPAWLLLLGIVAHGVGMCRRVARCKY